MNWYQTNLQTPNELIAGWILKAINGLDALTHRTMMDEIHTRLVGQDIMTAVNEGTQQALQMSGGQFTPQQQEIVEYFQTLASGGEVPQTQEEFENT